MPEDSPSSVARRPSPSNRGIDIASECHMLARVDDQGTSVGKAPLIFGDQLRIKRVLAIAGNVQSKTARVRQTLRC